MDNIVDKLSSSLEQQLSAEVQSNPNLPDLGKVNELQKIGSKLLEVESKIAALENELEELSQLRKELRQQTLPDMFDSAGVDIIGIPDSGVNLVLDKWASASLPKDDPEPGLKWLEDTGNGGLIKTTLSMEFGRGELEEAKKLEQYLRQKTNREITLVRKVHPQTLSAFVREKYFENDYKDGSVPLKLLGANVGRIVNIKKKRK